MQPIGGGAVVAALDHGEKGPKVDGVQHSTGPQDEGCSTYAAGYHITCDLCSAPYLMNRTSDGEEKAKREDNVNRQELGSLEPVALAVNRDERRDQHRQCQRGDLE